MNGWAPEQPMDSSFAGTAPDQPATPTRALAAPTPPSSEVKTEEQLPERSLPEWIANFEDLLHDQERVLQARSERYRDRTWQVEHNRYERLKQAAVEILPYAKNSPEACQTQVLNERIKKCPVEVRKKIGTPQYQL